MHYSYDVDWAAGDHELVFELQPLTPDEPQTRTLSMQITSVKVSGPGAGTLGATEELRKILSEASSR